MKRREERQTEIGKENKDKEHKPCNPSGEGGATRSGGEGRGEAKARTKNLEIYTRDTDNIFNF